MKALEAKLFSELLKNSRRSDRQLAKALGVSQPTVTRYRKRLMAEGWIPDFTIVPDFAKMGFEIIAITCVKGKETMLLEMENKAVEYMKNKPNIIFAGGGAQGMGMNGVMISLHRSYSDYSNFLTKHMTEWGEIIQDHFTILVSLRERIVKPFALKYLTEVLENL